MLKGLPLQPYSYSSGAPSAVAISEENPSETVAKLTRSVSLLRGSISGIIHYMSSTSSPSLRQFLDARATQLTKSNDLKFLQRCSEEISNLLDNVLPVEGFQGELGGYENINSLVGVDLYGSNDKMG